jgi:hypothetical protein
LRRKGHASQPPIALAIFLKSQKPLEALPALGFFAHGEQAGSTIRVPDNCSSFDGSRQLAKNLRQLRLAGGTRRNIAGDVHEDMVGVLHGITVEFQKQEHCHKSRSLVAIDERVIQDEREVKGRRHLEDVLMQKLPTEKCHGLRDGGFQETAVPKPVGAAVFGDLIGVKFQHIVDIKELWIQSASSFKAAR